MRPSTKMLSDYLAESIFPTDVERDALSAHLALARWFVCAGPQDLADMSSEILLKADSALAVAGEWLNAWQEIVHFATQRVRTNLPDNVVVMDRPRPPKS